MPPTFDTAKHLVLTLRRAGHQALLAGGCVRDGLLGRAPKDFDIATSAQPDQVRALFPRSEAVGAAFGVILVIEAGAPYEVATFRQDGSYKDGRRPEWVKFSTAEEDALRRDFTVNGMFLDPETGEILDHVGGREDLAKKVLRCIGSPERRFYEDKLRVLRAVRFAAELGFELEYHTWAAARDFAPQVTQVAWERLAQETGKLLVCAGRRRGLELMDQAGLLKALLPELEALKGVAQPPQYHPEGDVWAHTLLLMEKLEDPGRDLAWAGLLHDTGKPACFSHEPGDRIRFHGHEVKGAEIALAVARRFRLSRDSTDRIVALVRQHLAINQVREMRASTLKRLLRQEIFPDLLALHRADCLASHGDLGLHGFCLEKMEEFGKAGAQEALKPPPLLGGTDLAGMGFKPGPIFRRILDALETEQLEGRILERQQALDFVESHFGGKGKDKIK